MATSRKIGILGSAGKLGGKLRVGIGKQTGESKSRVRDDREEVEPRQRWDLLDDECGVLVYRLLDWVRIFQAGKGLRTNTVRCGQYERRNGTRKGEASMPRSPRPLGQERCQENKR